jgi:hypothetical protein
MDSKSADAPQESNLLVMPNVWIRSDGSEPTPWEAAEHVPGDLRIHFDDIRTLDKRMLASKLNKRQKAEVDAYRFFLPFGSDVESLSRAPRHNKPR